MPAAVQRHRRYTEEEYHEIDRNAPDGVRYEFWDGIIWPVNGYEPDGITAMAGAEPEHNQLKDNICRELGNRLTRRGCRVLSSDQKVTTGEVGRYFYPDVVVACRPEYDDSRPRILLNPELIVEVSSESTAEVDRGEKLVRYMSLPTVQEVWLADPGRPLVLQYLRPHEGEEEWRLRAYLGLDAAVRSEAFEVEAPLRDLYVLLLDDEQT
ncbi:MAG: Uma2 family endonuclease [Bacteroidota bacterium]